MHWQYTTRMISFSQQVQSSEFVKSTSYLFVHMIILNNATVRKPYNLEKKEKDERYLRLT